MKKKKLFLFSAGSALAGALLVLAIFWARPELALLFGGHLRPSRTAIPMDLQDPFATLNALAGPNALLTGQIAGLGMDFTELEEREDDSFVYYELKFAGQDGSKVDASVSEGYVTIVGEVRDSSTQQSFKRMFPLPPNVDGARMEIVSEKGKIVLKFPKRK